MTMTLSPHMACAQKDSFRGKSRTSRPRIDLDQWRLASHEGHAGDRDVEQPCHQRRDVVETWFWRSVQNVVSAQADKRRASRVSGEPSMGVECSSA